MILMRVGARVRQDQIGVYRLQTLFEEFLDLVALLGKA